MHTPWRLRDECLNEHWFLNLAHAQAIIEAWRREYNEERPKKGLGGLRPAAYAKQLARKLATVVPGLQTCLLLKPGGPSGDQDLVNESSERLRS